MRILSQSERKSIVEIIQAKTYTEWTETEMNICKDFWRKHGHPTGAGRTLATMLGNSKTNQRIIKYKNELLERLKANPNQDKELYQNLIEVATQCKGNLSKRDERLFFEGLEQFGKDFKLICQYMGGDIGNKNGGLTPSTVRAKYQTLRRKAVLNPKSVDPKFYDVLMFDGRSISSKENIKKAIR